ncbi:MAG: GFA family protein [Thioalkalispiraceae bacterium]
MTAKKRRPFTLVVNAKKDQGMYKGGCLCGGIRYEITGEITDIVYCHCSECRKAQGSAFATNGVVDTASFHILSGEDLLTSFEPSPGYAKLFCSKCGSPIISKSNKKPGVVRVRLGTIESDILERPQAHIFVVSKANWEEICGELPRFDEFPE